MKTIRISKGLITQVSDRDYSELRKFGCFVESNFSPS